ncbi:hypothetical protein DW262_02415 [Segatella copri]|uniref:Uncharacterized protein n=1 Tax=Segatella copri TaxID=165179 RepID=A0A3R6H7N1_9BACT|nr:hypothetical protein DW263_08785 [Segatella copri]RHG39164.1 hypothetical protein DW262_02415 [Segatella copri]RHG65355.1 hypothetical protein DW250_08645 [Segatella copri]
MIFFQMQRYTFQLIRRILHKKMKVDWFKTVQFLFAGQFCLKVIWRFRMELHETAKASNRNDGLKLLLIVCSA